MLTNAEIAGISTGIGLVAALAAVFQLRITARQGRHNATFEHLGRVRRLQRSISRVEPEEARKAFLAWWKRETEELSDEANSYLELLDEWDFLGIAYKERQVDRRIVLASLRNTLRTAYFVNREFIDEGKKLYENPNLYQHLGLLIEHCHRPTWKERLTDFRRRFDGRAKPKADAPTAAQPTLAGALPGGRDAGISSPAVAAPRQEVAVLKIQKLSDEEVRMAEQRPAVPTGPASTPQPGGHEQRETPAFRPPPPPSPPPAQTNQNQSTEGT